MKTNSINLAKEIHKNIVKDFEHKHLSGNYTRTMNVRAIDKNSAIITIPAPKYDMGKFLEDGVIVRIGGSYATELEKDGSKIIYRNGGVKHIGNHKKVVITSIKNGIYKFLKKGKKGQIIEWQIRI